MLFLHLFAPRIGTHYADRELDDIIVALRENVASLGARFDADAIRRLDTNGDGAIDRVEFSEALHRLGLRLTPYQVRKLIRRFESSPGSGVDYKAFLSMVSPLETRVKSLLRSLIEKKGMKDVVAFFQKFDAENNGILDQHEFTECLRAIGWLTTLRASFAEQRSDDDIALSIAYAFMSGAGKTAATSNEQAAIYVRYRDFLRDVWRQGDSTESHLMSTEKQKAYSYTQPGPWSFLWSQKREDDITRGDEGKKKEWVLGNKNRWGLQVRIIVDKRIAISTSILRPVESDKRLRDKCSALLQQARCRACRYNGCILAVCTCMRAVDMYIRLVGSSKSGKLTQPFLSGHATKKYSRT